MMTLLGSLLGFGTSIFPSILGYLQDGKDKKHELQSMELQMKLMDKQSELNIQETQVAGEMEAIALELQAEITSIKGSHKAMKMTGIKFIDGLRGSVRPVITYWFMGLYTYAKVTAYIADEVVWSEMDQALFATIIAFWFGDRIRKYYEANRR